jgi:hypothetical protein
VNFIIFFVGAGRLRGIWSPPAVFLRAKFRWKHWNQSFYKSFRLRTLKIPAVGMYKCDQSVAQTFDAKEMQLPSSIDNNLLPTTEQDFPMISDFPGKFVMLISLSFALMSQKELFASLLHRRLRTILSKTLQRSRRFLRTSTFKNRTTGFWQGLMKILSEIAWGS